MGVLPFPARAAEPAVRFFAHYYTWWSGNRPDSPLMPQRGWHVNQFRDGKRGDPESIFQFHIAQARAKLARLTEKYEVVKREQRLAEAMKRISKMHQIFVEDLQAILKRERERINQRQGEKSIRHLLGEVVFDVSPPIAMLDTDPDVKKIDHVFVLPRETKVVEAGVIVERFDVHGYEQVRPSDHDPTLAVLEF